MLAAVVLGAAVLVVGVVLSERGNTSGGGASPAAAPVETASIEPFTVAYLGDTLTADAGGIKPEDSFAYVLSDRMCWNGMYFGAENAGYTTSGTQRGESIVQQVERVGRERPKLVIVQSGTGDRGGARTTAASASVYAMLRTAVPTATIVVIGPIPPNGTSSRSVAATRDSIRASAAKARIFFIDPIKERWLRDTPSYFTDRGIHLSERGHEKMAELLGAHLRAARLGLPDCSSTPA